MPKTCVCVICGKEVLKNTTYFVGNGRACKSHEGVIQKAEERKQTEIERLASIVTKGPRCGEKRPLQLRKDLDLLRGPSCFICRKPGMHAKEYYSAILILMNMRQMRSEGEKIEDSAIAHDMEVLRKTQPIFILESKKYPDARKYLDWEMRTGFDTFGFFTACQKCCDKMGIDPNPLPKQMLKNKDGFINLLALGSIVSKEIKDKIKMFITKSN